MGKRSRHFALLCVILIALLASATLTGCSGTDADDGGDSGTEASGEPYVIGAILSLTGPYAGLGTPEENTIKLLVDQINAAGGVNGRPIEVIIEDDATEAEQTVAAATKLIDQDEVIAMIGATGSGQTIAMRDLIIEAAIPNVSVAGATAITGDLFSEWVFQTPWSNNVIVPYTLDYLEDQGISKIAVIADSGGFAQDGVAVMEGFLADYDIEVVAEETFDPTDSDMTAQLTVIKGSDAEAVVLWSAGSAAAIVAQNMATLEMDLPLFGSHGNARMEFIDGAGDAAEGFRFAAGKILIPDTYGEGSEEYDVAQSFIDDYTAEYGIAPNTFAGHAYDALMMIVDAIDTLDGDFTPAELRDAIEHTSDFVGIGGTFSFSATDHNGLSADDVVMYEVSNGAWVLAE